MSELLDSIPESFKCFVSIEKGTEELLNIVLTRNFEVRNQQLKHHRMALLVDMNGKGEKHKRQRLD